MATKKRTTRPRKRATTSRKKRPVARKKGQPFPYTLNLIGLILGLLAFLGISNLGLLGLFVANTFRLVVGDTYQVALALLGAYGIALALTGAYPQIERRFWVGGSLFYLGYLLLSSATLFAIGPVHTHFIQVTWQAVAADFASSGLGNHVGGGLIGAGLLTVTALLIAILGSQLLAWGLMLTGVVIFFNIPVIKIGRFCQQASQRLVEMARQGLAQRQARWQQWQAKRVKTADQPVTHQSGEERSASAEPAESPVAASDTPVSATPASAVASSATDSSGYHVTVASRQDEMAPTAASATPAATDDLAIDASDPIDPNYQLPTAQLLTAVPKTDQTNEINAIDRNTQVLKRTLDSFGVQAEIKNVSLGPSVTEYELHPAIGVKVSRIVNLADDLALALAAKDIRIEAPIPGKSLIGIEVPNKEVSTVAFRDVIEARPHHPDKLLEVPLGRDVTGKVITMDLTKMPHLLIAGSTGSGKSVAINGIITSILMNARPDQVKLMLIDPKKVELSVYNGIPHLLTPVVSEPKKAARALHKVVAEMERRYELFSQFGQRKISGYNAFVRQANAADHQARPTLPYIVVIVDELADLMMTVSNDVEDAIIRLAQMGRAAGVHMILATQRPSVDVITGLIKANVPSRIAFAVSSGIDSRTILDSNGAEKLLGRGDMLYLPIDANTPVRVQGAFISDRDVEQVVQFITDQQTAEYDQSMIVSDEEIQQEAAADSDDELFDEALAFVVDQQKASTSLLQRRFRIGYNRAARLIDDLEQRGYIGPQDGSKPRQVYKQKDPQSPAEESSGR